MDNPEKYSLNKTLIDKMYAEYLDVLREMCEMNTRTVVLNKDSDKRKPKGDEHLRSALIERLAPPEKSALLAGRYEILRLTMTHLLTGKELTEEGHMLLEQEHGIETQERRQHKLNLVKDEYNAIQRARIQIEQGKLSDLSSHVTEQGRKIALARFDDRILLKPSLTYLDEKYEEIKKIDRNADTKLYGQRQLRFLLKGYKTDRDGNPATPEDALMRDRDKALVDDYLLLETARRKKWLDEYCDEILSFELKEDMLNPDYIMKNYAKLADMAKKFLIIQNIMKETPDYFTENPVKAERIKERDRLGSMFASGISDFAMTQGVNADVLHATHHDLFMKRENDSDLAKMIEHKKMVLEDSADSHNKTIAKEKKRQAEIKNIAVLTQTQTRSRVSGIDPAAIIPFDEAQKENMRTGNGLRADKTATKNIESVNLQLKEEVTELFANMETAGFDYKTAAERTETFQVGRTKVQHSPETAAVMAKLYEMFGSYLENADYAKFFCEIYSNTMQLEGVPNGTFPTFESLESKVMSDCMCKNVLSYAHIANAESKKTEDKNQSKIDFLSGIHSNAFYAEVLFKDGGATALPPDAAAVLEKYAPLREKLLSICREKTSPDIIAAVKDKFKPAEKEQKNIEDFEDTSIETEKLREQEKNRFAGGQFVSAHEHYSELEKSKKWYSQKDSPEFEQVKQSMKNIFTAATGSVAETSITDFLKMYQNVINDAVLYLESHSGFAFTSVGRQRKRIMKDILKSARRDYASIPEAYSRQLKKPVGEQSKTWSEVLVDARTERIDISKMELSVAGDQTSTVLVIKDSQKIKPTLFFKDEEKLLSHTEERTQKCLELEKEFKKRGAKNEAAGIAILRKFEKSPQVQTEIQQALYTVTTMYPEAASVFPHAEARQRLISELKNNAGWKQAGATDEEKADIAKICQLVSSSEQYFLSLKRYYKACHIILARSGVTESAGIATGTMLSTRNVATTRMADIFDIAPMMARSKTIIIEEKGKQRRGNAMEGAKGIKHDDLSREVKEALKTCPDYLRDLSKMHLFDYICGQVDRHCGNFFVDAEMIELNGERVLRYGGICGIDNDMSFGTLTKEKFVIRNRPVNEMSQLCKVTDDNGELLLPYVDENMADIILALTPEMLTMQLADLLSKDEMKAFVARVKEVYKAVDTLSRKNPERLLKTDGWTGADPKTFQTMKFYRNALGG
jgi:hypothetical protein